jgi:ketosteroid isomerase-like protein
MTTAQIADIATLNQQLDDAILNGKALEAFEQYYADDVVMQENTAEPTVGKAANREREIQFFAGIEAFHGAKLIGAGASGDRSYSEWWMDITFKGGPRVEMTQVAARQWRNGQVVHERFYHQ